MNSWGQDSQIRYQIGRIQRTKCQGSRKGHCDAAAPNEMQKNTMNTIVPALLTFGT